MSWFKEFLDKLTAKKPVPDSLRSNAPAPPPPAPPAAPGKSPIAKSPAPPKKPEPKTLNLDASAFAPLSGADIVGQLKGKGSNAWDIFRIQFSGGMQWWGNRSIIPPSSDPRTSFIDRGMVGQGLVTPEELVEMHTIGDEMLRLRPALDDAALRAEEAVQQSKADKEAIKKQKKAEAEERKKQHAAGVARRKASDIIYLGRGVSKGLADRRANIEKLQAAGLPLLATPADVARVLGLTIPQLRWIAFHAAATTRPNYIRFTVPKRSGGTRELAAPHKKLRAAQTWIRTNILEKVPTHDAAHGFVKGRNTRTNALPHLKPAVLVNCDLENFFPTINVHRVIGLFSELGYSPAAATVLALLCTESPRRVVDYAGQTYHVATAIPCLLQGAPTSPAISNLIARRLDSRLAGIARKLNFTYTRYADDLTFSAGGDPAAANKLIGYLLARVRHITGDEGFVVNEEKTRVQRPNTSQRVTGIVINAPAPAIPRKTVRRLRAILHNAKVTGLASQNTRNHPHFESYVRGMISYVHMVNPAQAEKLRTALGQIHR